MTQARTDPELAAALDALTLEVFESLKADGALGVVVIVARADNAVVGCASDKRLQALWPAILRAVAGTIGAKAEIAAALVEARARRRDD